MSSPSLVPIAEGVQVWIGVAGDSNAGIIDTPDGPIVVDAQQTASLGRTLRSAAETTTSKPINCLIDTHFHLDHTAGNIAFADVPILAHQRTLERLTAILGGNRSGMASHRQRRKAQAVPSATIAPPVPHTPAAQRLQKVFWFFFSKKNFLLS